MFITFYDLETSGISEDKHEILQIAAVAFEVIDNQWVKLDQFERKVEFSLEKADPKALEMNSYDVDVWNANCITQKQAIEEFDSWVSKYADIERINRRTNRPFNCVRTAGHNIKGFDDKFIRKWYKSHGKSCPFDYAEIIDTLQLAMWKFRFGNLQQPENFKLETLCKVFDIEIEAHDALEDVMANARLAYRLVG